MSDIEELEGLASRGSAKGAAEDPALGDEGLVVAMPTSLFNSSSLARLSATEILSGVLVVDCDDEGGSVASAKGYSPAVATPQGDSTPTENFDLDPSYAWNPQGDGLLMQSFPYPVVLVSEQGRQEVCSRGSSNGRLGGRSWRYPVHKARMTFYFGSSREDLNSQACLGWTDIYGERAPQCLPLGGQSAWASAGSPGSGGRDAVLAVAGMDATSMFHDRAPGANSAASGLVALLAAAEAVGNAGRSGVVDLSALPRQIVFAAFQAEAYGFTGSRRFVKDVREGVDCQNELEAASSPTGMRACLDPLYPSLAFTELGEPAHVVSVDQVGFLPESTLWIHPSPGASAEDVATLSLLSPAGDVSVANATREELPPTPLTAFVKVDGSRSGFVIAGYDDGFASPHYHGIGDTNDTVDPASVAAAASLLAKSTVLLAGASDSSVEGLEVNTTLVETLLGCVTGDWACETFLEYVVGEIANIEEALGFRVRVDAKVPPTMYRGPLEFRNGGGLPTVRHTSKDGSWRLHPKWTEAFDPETDKIKLVPNILEMFCRAFLSEQLGSGHEGHYGERQCQSSGDCSPSDCQEGSAEAGGSESFVDAAECIRGRCACVRGFHHIALDVGLEREEQIDTYRVLLSDAELQEQGIPLWTEVFWGAIGVEVFLDPGEAVGVLGVALGLAFTVGAGVAAWVMTRSLTK